jgi:two-component system CheB/CheR fusion protein
LKLEPVDLNEIAIAIAAATHDALSAKRLSLKLEEAKGGLVALCDRVRTEQIFWNLINNAIKFTPSGGSIVATLTSQPGFAVVTVVDTGQGVPAEFLPHVFDMFAQAPQQLAQQNGGLGVGLAMVRDLAEAQGGKVFAESAGVDRGSSFSVWLPLSSAAASAPEIPQPGGTFTGLKILVVDDMADSLEPFAALLRLEGNTADTASDAVAALKLLEANSYDLLISDLGMENMDGFTFINEVRKRPGLSRLPAIALSGYGRPSDVKRALASGFNGHISKPATLAQVKKAVSAVLDKV